MRKFFYVLGVCAAVAIAAGAVGLFLLVRHGAALDAESKAYVDEAVVAISARWNKDELWERATPHLREITTAGALQALFDTASTRLGTLVAYRGAHGDANISSFVGPSGSRTTVSARYIADARFQNGDASFQITLLKLGERWMIEGFHIRWGASAKVQARSS